MGQEGSTSTTQSAGWFHLRTSGELCKGGADEGVEASNVHWLPLCGGLYADTIVIAI